MKIYGDNEGALQKSVKSSICYIRWNQENQQFEAKFALGGAAESVKKHLQHYNDNVLTYKRFIKKMKISGFLVVVFSGDQSNLGGDFSNLLISEFKKSGKGEVVSKTFFIKKDRVKIGEVTWDLANVSAIVK